MVIDALIKLRVWYRFVGKILYSLLCVSVHVMTQRDSVVNGDRRRSQPVLPAFNQNSP